MNIAIIEYEKDIDEALQYFPQKDCIYLSVSAEGSFGLYKRNMKFITDEDVLTPEEFKAIGNANFEIVGKWIDSLEEALLAHNVIAKGKEFRPFRGNFCRIKMLLDAVTIRKAVLDRLIERENPASIAAPPAASPEKISEYTLFFPKYESVYGALVEKIAEKKNIGLKRFSPSNIDVDAGAVKYDPGILIGRIRKAFERLLAMSDFRKSAKRNVLTGNVNYDIEPLIRRLSGRNNFYYYKWPSSMSSLKSFLKVRAVLPDELAELNIDGIFKPGHITGDPIVDWILNLRIQSYARQYIPVLWRELAYIESVDRDKNFAAYIHHAGSTDSFAGIPMNYFKREKKPIFIIQHGVYGFALNRYTEYCEFGHDGYFFGWGEGTKEMYDPRKKGNCEIIPTGSHLIETIRKNRRPKKTISRVCYVPKALRGYAANFPNGQPCLDSKLFLTEISFLEAMKPYLGRYDITYKAAPVAARDSVWVGVNPVLEWIKKNMPSMKIEYGFLTSMVHKFDIFILDFPGTSLAQTTASGAEVLVYAGNPYFELSEEALPLLRKRAVVEVNESDFKNRIRSILDKGVVVSDTEDTAFLKKYCVHIDDGNSLSRMSEHFEAIFY